MAVTITGGTSGSVTFADPSANFEAAAGCVLDTFLPEGPLYGVQENASPMVEISNTRNGFRGRRITIVAWYMAATYVGVVTAVKGDDDVFNQPCTVSDGTNSYPACEAQPYRIVEGPFGTGYGTYMAKVVWEFRQMRTS